MQLWKYRHYKWSIYEVISIAKHTETNEDMVVYKHYDEQGNLSFRVRPLKIFQEKIVVDGKEMKRFTYIGNE
jgi:hypothetical protein